MYQIYNDYVDWNQTFVFPHLELGSGAKWPFLLAADEPSSCGVQYVQEMVLNDPNWNFWDFNYTIVELADKFQTGSATAYEFDLSPFHERGGKLLQYHRLSDALIATGSSVFFYKEVLKTLMSKGIALDSWYRFFLVPGMQHCAATPTDVNAPWYFAGLNQAGLLVSAQKACTPYLDSWTRSTMRSWHSWLGWRTERHLPNWWRRIGIMTR